MPAGVFVGSNHVLIMDPAPVVYVKVFHTGSGPDRYIKRKAEAVAFLAKTLAPKGETGALAASVHVSPSRDEKGRYAFGYAVNADIGYAAYVHEGTGPSVRIADFGHSMSFVGTNGRAGRDGGMIHTPIVFHPGTPAQPFLQDALVAMVG